MEGEESVGSFIDADRKVVDGSRIWKYGGESKERRRTNVRREEENGGTA